MHMIDWIVSVLNQKDEIVRLEILHEILWTLRIPTEA